ncbi:hypothetical protein B0T21DRAFT_408650 [Apiosordaria backusii]|uniref:Cytochrome P450 n=1 Tax=Apiosordaria backusii TaxID=314023 RepID=A0AA40EM15_9PEZI|nr:hypothetical protein B0T21DRAFT_408650 [Apiosordaria backusii]
MPPMIKAIPCYTYFVVTYLGILASACIGWLCTLFLLLVHKLETTLRTVHAAVLQSSESKGQPQEDIEVWLRNQKSIINFSFADASKPHDTLPIRAEANENIAIAFGLINSLTTTSPSIHKSFLKTASSIINRPDRDWTALFETATSTLKTELNHVPGQSLPLAEVTRITCLTVVLVDNFNIPSPISRQSLVIITEEINNQWLKAKSSTPHSRPAASSLLNGHLSSLNLTLRSSTHVLPPEEILSIIIPQYETLWRVVLVTYLLAFHLYPSPTLPARISSVPGCLGSNSDAEKEALKLAKEGLRLTPSNKRIYRHSPTVSDHRKAKLNADLELLHRHPSIWGPSALEFNPSRFDSLTPLQTEAYLPYSLRPHRCPAFGGFGDRMVTCLVAAMGRVLGTSGAGRVSNTNDKEGQKRQVIKTARDKLEGWRYTLCK